MTPQLSLLMICDHDGLLAARVNDDNLFMRNDDKMCTRSDVDELSHDALTSLGAPMGA